MNTKKTVLITGTSSGFGRLAAQTFHQKGWNVVATMRSPEKETELVGIDGIMVTKLDVTDPESIKKALEETLQTFGKLDVLVNNAGYGGHAVFEQATDIDIRAMYDTNVFGTMNVMREVLPHMRENMSGTVINVTSMAGMLGLPGNSVYSSSKHAVEGLTEAMAIEYRPFNINIKSVLPGAYPTTRFNDNVTDHLSRGDDSLSDYSQRLNTQIQAVGEQMSLQQGKVSDPQEVADMIYSCAVEKDRPVHNPVGADSHMIIEMLNQGTRDEFINTLAGMLLPSDVEEKTAKVGL